MKKSLDDETVHKICKLLEEGYNNTEISEMCKVNKNSISKIRCGKVYTDISKNYNISRLYNDILSDETVHKICKLMEECYSNKEICEKFKVNKDTISQIRCGNGYTDISKNYNISRLCNDRLSDETVYKICKLIEEGYNNIEISEMCKVNRNSINHIRCGEAYAHISKNYNISKLYNDILSDETVHKICKLMEEGYRNIDISIDLDIDSAIISQIRCGFLYSNISKNYNINRRYKRGKINDDIMYEICKMKQNGMSVKDISKELGIRTTAIYRALKIPKFEHIRRHYNL